MGTELDQKLHFLYEYIQQEQIRNENALTVAINNFSNNRSFDFDKASELMALIDRKEYFEKVSQDLFVVIHIMRCDL